MRQGSVETSRRVTTQEATVSDRNEAAAALDESPTTRGAGARPHTPQLIWIGDGGWIAYDPEVPENDPRRILAYVECKDHRVYVLWVRGRSDLSVYPGIREALSDIADTAIPA